MATPPSRLALLLRRPTRLELWGLHKLVSVERFFYVQVRRESFSERTLPLVLLLASAMGVCAALILSRTSTFGEANYVCKERLSTVLPHLDNNLQEFLPSWTILPGTETDTTAPQAAPSNLDPVPNSQTSKK